VTNGNQSRDRSIIVKAFRKYVKVLTGLFLMASAATAFAYAGQKLAGEAKISLEQARVIALKAQHGKITDQELEHEKGGSGLRYSFAIRHGKVTQEVGVDARTGKLLENAPEGPNAD
jgi:uncharacterized membrane protein YkoI